MMDEDDDDAEDADDDAHDEDVNEGDRMGRKEYWSLVCLLYCHEGKYGPPNQKS